MALSDQLTELAARAASAEAHAAAAQDKAKADVEADVKAARDSAQDRAKRLRQDAEANKSKLSVAWYDLQRTWREHLAKIRDDNPPVAERFEAFLGPYELANGYHELTDATEQRARFTRDNERRRARGQREMPVDERLLAALVNMPACAGVDRVLRRSGLAADWLIPCGSRV